MPKLDKVKYWVKRLFIDPAQNDEETAGSPRFRQTVAAIHAAPTKEEATKIALNAAKDRAVETAMAFAIPLSGGIAGPVVADAVNTAFAIDGLYNLASKNGVQKTYRLAKEGDWSGAARSATGDALNIAMTVPTIRLLGRVGRSVAVGRPLKNAYVADVVGREIEKATPTITKASTIIPESRRLFRENTYMGGSNPQEAATTVHFDPRVKPLSRPISEAEIQGIPKVERNNISKKKDIDIQLFFERLNDRNNWTPRQSKWNYTGKGRSQKIPAIDLEKNSEFNSLIKDYIKYLPDEIDPRFTWIETPYSAEPTISHKGFFEYLQNEGISLDLSPEEVSKFLTARYKDLSKEATGKLKTTVLWHGSPTFFEKFDYMPHVGDVTGNTGGVGPGNYFTVNGGYEKTNMQPYIATGIKSTPSGDILFKKGVLKNNYSNNKGNDLWEKILKESRELKNTAILDFHEGASGIAANYPLPLTAVVIPRNTGIKSLFPHPSRFYRDVDGTVKLIPTNWSDPRVNFKNGGKLKQK